MAYATPVAHLQVVLCLYPFVVACTCHSTGGVQQLLVTLVFALQKNSYHAVLTTSHVLLLPLQGYLAALASAVASLETSTATLNATTLALGPLLNSTFGAAAAQAETSGAAAATTAYQVGA